MSAGHPAARADGGRIAVRRIVTAFGVRPVRIRRVTRPATSALGNRHWLVWCDTGARYVLREHAAGRSAAAIAYEAGVIRHAADAGWPVPLLIRPSLTHGDSLFSLLKYFPGRSLRAESAAQQRRRGALLAELHADLRGATTFGQRPTWWPLHDLDALRGAVGWEDGLAALSARRPDLVSPLRAAMTSIEPDLKAAGADAVPRTVIYGDFTRWNLLFAAGSLSGVIDWDLTHFDSRPADLAMARAAGNPALIDGYRAAAIQVGWPLSPEEEAAVAPLDAAMRIGMVGWELLGLRLADTMDTSLVQRQVQRLIAYASVRDGSQWSGAGAASSRD